jgi:arginyl-tRNA synthetase
MTLQQILTPSIEKAVKALFDVTIDKVEFQTTRKEFEGDITMVIFPLLKVVKSNVVSGFLNIVISDEYYLDFFGEIKDDVNFGFVTPKSEDKAVMVEYSSPNTNKPLHLGHVRNNLLGYAVAEIIKASGKKVYKTQIINDRGIHICKSMLAWKLYGKGETPQSTGLKGDKLVGKYYVVFDREFKKNMTLMLEEAEKEYEKKYKELELNNLIDNLGKIAEISIQSAIYSGSSSYNSFINSIDDNSQHLLPNHFSNYFISNLAFWGVESKNKFDLILQSKEKLVEYKNDSYKIKREIFEDLKKNNPLQILAQQMLIDWEAGKPEVIELWKTMNQWVYDGFAISYRNLGVDFDKYYYESNTYLLGKDVVQIGLDRGVFEKDPDGSVWIDLTDEGLDRKIVLRSDGTAVYMTQDIGTAIQRVKDYPDVGGMVYTVGNEQDYHFKVLFLILKKLGFEWSKNLFHLSYGMVDLPSGKMKSREGTVVDADDLMQEMADTAQKIAEDLGKLDTYSAEEKSTLYKTIGLGALKYYILKVDPKKRILFNPEESVDFAGNTGPFIQYTYARIQSIIRKANFDFSNKSKMTSLHEKEKELVKQLELFPEVIQNAAQHHSPALLANFTYDLVREYNSFYQAVPILGEEDLEKKIFRVQLSKKVADTIAASFKLLGISVPERM